MTDEENPSLPLWAPAVLAMPGTGGAVHLDGAVLHDDAGSPCGTVVEGIACFGITPDDAISYYESIGGTHFHERADVAYTMSSLDTPVYHDYLKDLAPADRDALIVDVGGGDGRNTEPWLEWGFNRVVLIDPIKASLLRFRQRVAARHPEWLPKLLLIQGDARRLPLATGAAQRMFAIEAICYLNDDAPLAIAECARSLAADGQLLVSVRGYEAGLIIRALYYGGAAGMLELGEDRDMWDGVGTSHVRNRCYTKDEIVALIVGHGFRVLRTGGISILSVILSFLRGIDRLGEEALEKRSEVQKFLKKMGNTGSFLRTYLVVAARSAPIDCGEDSAP